MIFIAGKTILFLDYTKNDSQFLLFFSKKITVYLPLLTLHYSGEYIPFIKAKKSLVVRKLSFWNYVLLDL